MTSQPGRLVAIEGIDGAGKNTLTTALAKDLEASGHSVARVAFPRYGTFHADIAAGALRGRMGPVAASPEAMAVLFALDRATAAEWLAETLASHDVVLADRYVASNAAYTTARLGQESFDVVTTWMDQMEHGEMGVPRPAAYILVPTAPAEARRRAEGRAAGDASRALDEYERDAQLQADTAAAYDRLAAEQWVAPWWIARAKDAPSAAAAVLARNICGLT